MKNTGPRASPPAQADLSLPSPDSLDSCLLQYGQNSAGERLQPQALESISSLGPPLTLLFHLWRWGC